MLISINDHKREKKKFVTIIRIMCISWVLYGSYHCELRQFNQITYSDLCCHCLNNMEVKRASIDVYINLNWHKDYFGVPDSHFRNVEFWFTGRTKTKYIFIEESDWCKGKRCFVNGRIARINMKVKWCRWNAISMN